MHMFTTDTIPPRFELVDTHGVISYLYTFQIQYKNAIQRAMASKEPGLAEGLAEFEKYASSFGHNAVFGIRVSSSIGISGSSAHMYITHHATLATIRERESK